MAKKKEKTAIEGRLTSKQIKFCEFYAKTGNATQSAIDAGYSKADAAKTGFVNLHNPKVCQYLEEIVGAEREERIASADEVLAYLSSVLRGEPQDETGLPPKDSDRLRAAELLGKRYALYTERVESKADDKLVVKIVEVD